MWGQGAGTKREKTRREKVSAMVAGARADGVTIVKLTEKRTIYEQLPLRYRVNRSKYIVHFIERIAICLKSQHRVGGFLPPILLVKT